MKIDQEGGKGELLVTYICRSLLNKQAELSDQANMSKQLFLS